MKNPSETPLGGLTPVRASVAQVLFLASAAVLFPRPVVSAPEPAAPIFGEGIYAVSRGERVFGFSRYSVEPSVQVDGNRFSIISSEARIKLNASPTGELSYTSRLMVDEQTLRPSFFFCRQAQGSQVTEVECLFTEHTVAHKTRLGRMGAKKLELQDESVVSLKTDEPAHLLFENVWGRLDTFAEHYALLLARPRALSQPVTCYDPILRSRQTLRFVSQGVRPLRIGNHTTSARSYRILDERQVPLATVWLSPARQVLRYEDAGGLALTLTDRSVESRLKQSAGLDAETLASVASNVWIPDPQRTRALKVAVEARVPDGSALDRATLGWRQKHTGSVVNGEVKGTLEIASQPVVVRNSSLYPSREPLDEAVAAFALLPTDPANDELRSKGAEIAWKARTSWEAVKRINSWVKETIKPGGGLPSAMATLEQKAGNAPSRALLAESLMRAVGVPARRVRGYVFAAGTFVPHEWVEAWIGPPGWVALDPTSGEEGQLSATHVALSDLPDPQLRQVQVQQFDPRPPARTAFFNNELRWAVGEERIYTIQHAGREVGREVAAVRGLVRDKGRDAYQMELSLELDLDGTRRSGTASLLLEPRALPLAYSVTLRDPAGASQSRKFEVRGAEIVELASPLAEVGQATPLTEGAYLVDGQLMSLYALAVGQIPSLKLDQAFTLKLYDPCAHSYRDLALRVTGQDRLTAAGAEHEVWRLSGEGLTFFADKASGAVLRIEQMQQDLVLQLQESRTRI